MFDLKSIQDADVKNKKVFVRCDFDIPLVARGPVAGFLPESSRSRNTDMRAVGSPAAPVKQASSFTSFVRSTSATPRNFEIVDDTRLISSISTIEYLMEEGANVIIAGHLGRPSTEFKIQNSKFKINESEFSLRPIAKWYDEQFSAYSKKSKLNDFPGWEINTNLFLLENLRFFEGEENPSSSSGQEFVKKLSSLADIYVNEAFGASHRNHASIVGVASLLPHFAGFHLLKEIKILSRILENPKRPLTVIIGGAKIETKLPMVKKMHSFADYILVGGEIAEQTKILMDEEHRKIRGQKADLIVAKLTTDKYDITDESLSEFLEIIKKSETIVWNGPMGKINSKFEIRNSKLSEGDEGYTSLKLAEAIIESKAYKVVGGGDTIGFLNQHGLLSKFDFASVGGGAMLEFLSGVKLPGLVALGN
ncbi:MAG: hypothetical protein A3A51_00535 [Candidatus Levybacteria bacterium RIFCSPLOWO2_01_FULL_39_10]|nr:MAG: hypothetical protein A3A51_00535 [Candidatus Levybacteria bacterium RIFCSPLOWO2_01_FULL_39_10]